MGLGVERGLGSDRERILNSAKSLIASHDYEATGESAIAAVLELGARPGDAELGRIFSRQAGPPSVGALYRHCAKVLAAMLERGWDYSESEARAALSGAEAVLRREIAAGRAAQLPRLLPDLVYSVAVPFGGQAAALWMARRGRELLRGTAWQ